MKTLADCWQALLDGETLENKPNGNIVTLSDSDGKPRDQHGKVVTFMAPEQWEIKQKPPRACAYISAQGEYKFFKEDKVEIFVNGVHFFRVNLFDIILEEK